MGKKVEFYYFSGTGNTSLIINEMRGRFIEKGMDVNLHELENGFLSNICDETILGIASPLNSKSVSPFIWKFLEQLPKSNGTSVFVVTTCNDTFGTMVRPLFKLLSQKGYIPKGICELSLPNNMLLKKPDSDKDEARLRDAVRKAADFAAAFAEGEVRWPAASKSPGFVSFLSRCTGLPWATMRLMFKLRVDDKKCAGCGLCIKSCPVRNISMDETAMHKNKCEFCMRCAAFCPMKAVYVKGRKDIIIRKAGEEST